MPGLGLAEVSLRNASTGLDITVFDIDPESYDPFAVTKRGSVHQTLDGSTIYQEFGVNQRDFVITIAGTIVDIDTLTALWTKYRTQGGLWEWRDWYGNKFNVIFTPGQQSFHPVPIRGSCRAFTYAMNLTVCAIVEWFAGAY